MRFSSALLKSIPALILLVVFLLFLRVTIKNFHEISLNSEVFRRVTGNFLDSLESTELAKLSG